MALPQAEEVFWWWDDGLISYEEAEEFLLLLDSQDEEGFCSLLESTLNQKCELEKQKRTKRKNQNTETQEEIEPLDFCPGLLPGLFLLRSFQKNGTGAGQNDKSK